MAPRQAPVGPFGPARGRGAPLTFGETARSFRAARTSELAGIRETRLRVREARPEESAKALAERTSSTWSGEKVAIANGAADDVRFDAGYPVKVAISQDYTRRGR